ncbi:uncharacterized protein BT62DRAFT_526244 [Guyanagaster necrorhizus]|uniref:Uncharacterized protein n=1 Tax=Guyanagaster necrorhizus TaxID=856835 RepID=A0A9P7W262_9AGAR|nr:uncharacterized protein BT62DRAFT_526244 [Guyanagaster necrorhizus MCA 3950]KAG7450615.1 hypothetical protein BT62DRAFT_526244 [Guyanagaster necrorhizus MCA 3950]
MNVSRWQSKQAKVIIRRLAKGQYLPTVNAQSSTLQRLTILDLFILNIMESANAYAAALSTLLSRRAATASSLQGPSKRPRAIPDVFGKKYNPMCRKMLGKGAFLKDETLVRAKDGKIIRSPETESQSMTRLVQNGNTRHGIPRHECPDFGGHATRTGEDGAPFQTTYDLIHVDTSSTRLDVMNGTLAIAEDCLEGYGTMYSYTGNGLNVEIDVDPWQLSEENRIFDMFINVEECAA